MDINNIITRIGYNFDELMNNTLFSTFITVFLCIYGALIGPRMPKFVITLFNNFIFKILIISIIAYRANKNPQLSLLFAIIFVLTINAITDNEHLEAFKQIETFQNAKSEFKVLNEQDHFISDD